MTFSVVAVVSQPIKLEPLSLEGFFFRGFFFFRFSDFFIFLWSVPCSRSAGREDCGWIHGRKYRLNVY